MKKERKPKVQNDYVEELKKRQWYEPGIFTGEDIPLSRPKLLGWFSVISAIILGLIMAYVLLLIFQTENYIAFIVIFVISYGILALQFIGGWGLLKKSSRKESLLKIKKAFIMACSCIAAIFMLTMFLNSTILKRTSSIMIEDLAKVQLIDEGTKHYMIVNDGQLTLRCSSSDSDEIWSVRVTEDNAMFEIQYKWNVISPNKGRVIQIIRTE